MVPYVAPIADLSWLRVAHYNERMFRAFTWIKAAALLAFLAIGAAPSAAAVDHQHDFDFEFGAWKADLKILIHPFAHSHTYADFRGTSIVRRIWGGRANLGELEVGNAQTHIEGLSFRLYDPRAHQWHVYFSNSANGALGVAAVGRFDNGVGEFSDTESIDGRPTRVGYLFSNMTPTSFSFIQSFSIDGGHTWEREWIATFTK